MKQASYTETLYRKREILIVFFSLFLLAIFMYLEFSLVEYLDLSLDATNLIIFVIININVLLVLLIIFLILRNIAKYFFEDKYHILSSKLRNRLIIAFVSVSLITTTLLFYVSAHFLMTSLESWFNKKVENALEKAIIIARSYIKLNGTILKNVANEIKYEIFNKCYIKDQFSKTCINDSLKNFFNNLDNSENDILKKIELIQFIINDHTNISFKKRNFDLSQISKDILNKSLENNGYLITNDLEKNKLIKFILPINTSEKNYGYLVIGQVIDDKSIVELDAIKAGFEEYKQLLIYKKPIKTTLLLILSLITLLILFIAIWFGVKISKGITEPLNLLSEATKKIAQGDLDFTIKAKGYDELVSLINAFNKMTLDLKEARKKAEEINEKLQKSYIELDNKIRYNEILLKNVAAGVISIDKDGIITTINQSAEKILQINSENIIGKHYYEVIPKEEIHNIELIKKELEKSPSGTLQKQITLNINKNRIPLFIKITQLKDLSGNHIGVVIVFDDLTEFEQAQKIATWREVARRVAHEFKNPLTPIQLSAQRIRKKYIEDASDLRDVILRCTETIVKQVEDLKLLVNEFSNFAKMPSPKFSNFNLIDIIKEVWIMYKDNYSKIEFILDINQEPINFYGDPSQLKRVLINLLDNAIESIENSGKIILTVTQNTKENYVKITIADTGKGILKEDINKIFEPYFSKKKDGTGLGLTIVKNIIEDHNGTIEVDPNYTNGAKFIITLPLKG